MPNTLYSPPPSHNTPPPSPHTPTPHCQPVNRVGSIVATVGDLPIMQSYSRYKTRGNHLHSTKILECSISFRSSHIRAQRLLLTSLVHDSESKGFPALTLHALQLRTKLTSTKFRFELWRGIKLKGLRHPNTCFLGDAKAPWTPLRASAHRPDGEEHDFQSHMFRRTITDM